MSALMFSIVLHIGSAAKNLLDLSQPIERTLSDTVADFVDLALFGVIMAAAAICYYQQSKSKDLITIRTIFIPIVLLVPLILYSSVWFYILPVLSENSLFILSEMLAVIAVFGLLLSTIFVIRTKLTYLPLNKGYFVTSMLLFVISTISLLGTLSTPSMGWEYPETLQMAGFLIFCIALSVPFLKSSGFTRKGAYTFSIGLVLVAYFPFLITIALESLSLNRILEPLNLLAYSIIHIGAGSLAGMTAILLLKYPKRKISWNHYPLVLLFGLWRSITFILLFAIITPGFAPLGEPITPYTVGSVLTLFLLLLAIYWTTNPPPADREHPTVLKLSLAMAVMIILVVVGEIINQIALRVNPDLVYNPLGSIIILCTNLVIMFAFAHLIFLLSARAKGTITIELYVVIFLAMWTLPNILKSYYGFWESGWWVSEEPGPFHLT